MKNTSFIIVLILLTSSFISCAQTNKTTDAWFSKKEWLSGLNAQPHSSINKKEFQQQYDRNKKYWDEAFAFLKNTNLDTLSTGRYNIDGDNVYAIVTENPTKDLDSAKWESHRNYIDLQMVIKAEEKIGVAPIESLSVTMPYDSSKDLINYEGKGTYAGMGTFYLAQPNTFFLFFPSDAHRPNVTTGGNKADKKVVLKIRYAS